MLAIQHQRRIGRARPLDLRRRGDARGLRIKDEIQMGFGDAEIGRAILCKTNGARVFGAHGNLGAVGTAWVIAPHAAKRKRRAAVVSGVRA